MDKSRPNIKISSDPGKRPNRQQVAAAATRREILMAARRLFAKQGYARTSVAEIADEAGASLPTIYANVGAKKTIVMALRDLIGEEAGADEAVAQVAEENDPVRLIGLATGLNRRLQERVGDILNTLRSAAQVEPDVALVLEDGWRTHRAGAERLAKRLDAINALRSGVGIQEAADVISFLTDVECYTSLVGRYGWTFDRAEQWIGNALRLTLLEG